MFFRVVSKIKIKIRYIAIKWMYHRYIRQIGKNIEFRTIPVVENFKKLTVRLGENIVIKENLIIRGGGNLKIGDNTHIGSFVIIGCNEEVKIGKDCMIADYCTLRDTNHNFRNLNISMNKQGITAKKIIIEDDVWIGHGAIILSGINVAKGSIVAAGSVVTKNVGEYEIVAGNPAKTIGSRRDEQ